MTGTAIVLAQSSELDALAEEIRWHEAQALSSWREALYHKYQSGLRLIRAKRVAGHGDFQAWIEREFDKSAQWARLLMRFAKLVEQNESALSFLPEGTGVERAVQLLASDGQGGAAEPASTDMGPFALDLPRNDYRIVLADPPWQYQSWSGKSKDTSKRRVVEDEYDTMPLEAIKALPVASACAKDAVLLCWATMPLLREALQVIEAWGFEYRTAFLVWGKSNADGSPAVGFGRYTRSNGELLLLGRRGDGVKTVPGVAISNLLVTQRRGHSEKPHRQYEIIDRVFGQEVPRVELFARQRMARWDVWGHQAPDAPTLMDVAG